MQTAKVGEGQCICWICSGIQRLLRYWRGCWVSAEVGEGKMLPLIVVLYIVDVSDGRVLLLGMLWCRGGAVIGMLWCRGG